MAKIQEGKKQSVIKHSASIQINNVVSLLQRKAWNVLLANAYDELLKTDEHSMELTDLSDMLGFGDTNYTYLKRMLIALNTTQIEWNILGKDGAMEWGTTTFLAGATIKNGKVYYGYFKGLREKLYNPKMYARINLRMQNNFSSKYALALYELCIDYYDTRRACGETPWIPISIYKKLMGVGTNEYQDFRDLRKRLITNPIEEIHAIEDSEIRIDAVYRPKRNVEKLKFKITRKPGLKPLPVADPDLFDGSLIEELQKFGMEEKSAQELVHTYSGSEIWQWVESVKLGFSKIDKNPSGFFFKALADYDLPKAYLEHKKESEQKKVNDKVKEEKEITKREIEKKRVAEEKRTQKKWDALDDEKKTALIKLAILGLQDNEEMYNYLDKYCMENHRKALSLFTVEDYEQSKMLIKGTLYSQIVKILEK